MKKNLEMKIESKRAQQDFELALLNDKTKLEPVALQLGQASRSMSVRNQYTKMNKFQFNFKIYFYIFLKSVLYYFKRKTWSFKSVAPLLCNLLEIQVSYAISQECKEDIFMFILTIFLQCKQCFNLYLSLISNILAKRMT